MGKMGGEGYWVDGLRKDMEVMEGKDMGVSGRSRGRQQTMVDFTKVAMQGLGAIVDSSMLLKDGRPSGSASRHSASYCRRRNQLP